jgi:hypothetical protein
VKLGDIMRPDEESEWRLGADYAIVEVSKQRRGDAIGWRCTVGLVVKQGKWRLVRRVGSAVSPNQRWPYHGLGLRIVYLHNLPPPLRTPEEQAKLDAAKKARAQERRRVVAAASLKRWQRKAKLAATKVKQYTRLTRRLGVAA